MAIVQRCAHFRNDPAQGVCGEGFYHDAAPPASGRHPVHPGYCDYCVERQQQLAQEEQQRLDQAEQARRQAGEDRRQDGMQDPEDVAPETRQDRKNRHAREKYRKRKDKEEAERVAIRDNWRAAGGVSGDEDEEEALRQDERAEGARRRKRERAIEKRAREAEARRRNQEERRKEAYRED